jgi:hypothetical protein
MVFFRFLFFFFFGLFAPVPDQNQNEQMAMDSEQLSRLMKYRRASKPKVKSGCGTCK